MGSLLLALLVLGGSYLAFTRSPVRTFTGGASAYREITEPAGYVNSEPFTIGEFVGNKVILVDFMTYSCINCQRTFPYVTAWYERYKEKGLVIIGVHTPEFAFEKDIKNVRNAMREFGITYPVVLDNSYGTWRAYGNQYWPRKYLIDIHGNIVYDHIGEGAYEETETKIRELLAERAQVLGTEVDLTGTTEVRGSKASNAQSPETYFGALRNTLLGNGTPGRSGLQTFMFPSILVPNTLYLHGPWNIAREYAEGAPGSALRYRYTANEVYLVAESDPNASIEVWLDGALVTSEAGTDVMKGMLHIGTSRLYSVIKNNAPGEHVLELRVRSGTVRLYAFTFG